MEGSFLMAEKGKKKPGRKFPFLHKKKGDESDVESCSTCSTERSRKRRRWYGLFSAWRAFIHYFNKSPNMMKMPLPDGTDTIGIQFMQTISDAHKERANTTYDTGGVFEETNASKNDNALLMAITLPKGIKGSDVKVSIEIKAIANGKEESSSMESGIHLKEICEHRTVYSGNIKVPLFTTFYEISKMPIYLLNGDPNEEDRVEIIISPFSELLPENTNYNGLVSEIHVTAFFDVVQFSNLFTDESLSYTFLSNYTVNSSINKDKTEALVEQVTEEAEAKYDESSKIIVKDILNQVVNKVTLRPSHNLIHDFRNELDVQRELLIQTSVTQIQKNDFPLERISESEQEAFSSISLDSSKLSSKSSGASNVPLEIAELTYQLKVPSNTPLEFIYQCEDADLNSEIYPFLTDYNRWRWSENNVSDEVKADIDKTLDLLETVKNKLIYYLNHNSLMEVSHTKLRNYFNEPIIVEHKPIESMLSPSGAISNGVGKTIAEIEFFRTEEETETAAEMGESAKSTQDIVEQTADEVAKTSSLTTETQAESRNTAIDSVNVPDKLVKELDNIPNELEQVLSNEIYDTQTDNKSTTGLDPSQKESNIKEEQSFRKSKSNTLRKQYSVNQTSSDLYRNMESLVLDALLTRKFQDKNITKPEALTERLIPSVGLLREQPSSSSSGTRSLNNFKYRRDPRYYNIERQIKNFFKYYSIMPKPSKRNSRQSNEYRKAEQALFDGPKPDVQKVATSSSNTRQPIPFDIPYGERNTMSRITSENYLKLNVRYDHPPEEVVNVSQGVMKQDIKTILQELLHETHTLKEDIISKIGDKYQTEPDVTIDASVYEDVNYVLNSVLDRVVEESRMKRLNEFTRTIESDIPKVCDIKPVYYCLIDGYFNSPFLTNNVDNPFAWITSKLKNLSKSTKLKCPSISVRKYKERNNSLALMPYLASPSLNYTTHGGTLFERLEGGISFMQELCREIYFSPSKRCSTTCQATNENDTHHPVLRKSDKLIKYKAKERPSSANSSTTSQESEKVECVINNEPETTAVTDFQSISWKAEWKRMLDNKSLSYGDTNEVGSFLSERWANFCTQIRNSPENVLDEPNRKLLKPAKKLTPVEGDDTDENDDKFISSSEKILKTIDIDDKPPKMANQISEKRTLFNLADSEEAKSVHVLHENRTSSDFTSVEQIPTVASIIPVNIAQSAADIPRVFDSSGVERAYMKNVELLQEKINNPSLKKIQSSSSSENSIVTPKSIPTTSGIRKFKTEPTQRSSMPAATASNISLINCLDYATEASVITSRSGSSVRTSDYYGDRDSFYDCLPNLKLEYASKTSLNAADEIAKIDENVLRNSILNPPPKQDEMRKDKQKMPISVVEHHSSYSSDSSISLASDESDIQVNLN